MAKINNDKLKDVNGGMRVRPVPKTDTILTQRSEVTDNQIVNGLDAFDCRVIGNDALEINAPAYPTARAVDALAPKGFVDNAFKTSKTNTAATSVSELKATVKSFVK